MQTQQVVYEEKVDHLFPPIVKHVVTRLRQLAPLKMGQLIQKYAYFAGGSVAGVSLGLTFLTMTYTFLPWRTIKVFRQKWILSVESYYPDEG